jgi:hypothetical protein
MRRIRTGRLMLLLAVAVVVVGSGLVVGGLLAPWRWGTVPEWGAALGTVFTLFYFGLSGGWDRRRQFDLDREAQARLFDVWPETAQPSPGDLLNCTVALSNTSAAVMRGVDVRFELQGTQLGPVWRMGRVPPNPPGNPLRKACTPSVAGVADMSGWDEDIVLGGISLAVSFTDGAGNRWHRTVKGGLVHLYNLNDPPHEPEK